MFRSVAIIAALIVVFCSSVSGQLTSEDITALKERAAEEGWTFTVSENPATQHSLTELCGLSEPTDWRETGNFDPCTPTRALPVSFDWRAQGGCTPVKYQGGCGSCWAFSTVGALECNILIRDGTTVDLSEQYLVSCNTSGWGCDGGWLAHDYHQWRPDPCGGVGAVLEEHLPYVALDLPCYCPYPHDYLIDSWAYIGSQSGVPSINSLKQAIVDYGPISVCVTANSAMQAYSGGIFNACSVDDINHAVVLVGWDDSQGENGVWIMRNSWSSGWGEGGYMRIEYYCSRIGYGGAYVDYIGGASFEADTRVGWAPFEAAFTGMSGLEVDTWTWDFGDGGSAHIQSPSHVYEERGLYDVTIQVDVGGDIRSRTRNQYIAALADTLRGADILYDPECDVEVVISAINTIPLREIAIPVLYSGDIELVFDSFATTGCRTDYFEEQTQIQYVPSSKKMYFRLITSLAGSSPDLDPGSGDLLRLWFHVEGTPSYNQETSIILSGYTSGVVERRPIFRGAMAEYEARVVDGLVAYSTCCEGIRGNMDGDPEELITISDLVYLVDYMFNNGPACACYEESDINGDDSDPIDVADLVHLVDYMFNEGAPPSPCF